MHRIHIVAFFGASVLYFVSLYVYVPILPAFIAERTSNLTAVGVVLSMYGLWTAVSRMPLGILSDATGRKKLYLVGGTLMSGVGALVMAFGTSVGTMALGRALTGLAAATWVPMMVVFASFFPPGRAIFATSLLSFASSLGMVIGTGSTGFIVTKGGDSLAFQVAAGLSIAAGLTFAVVRIPSRGATRSDPVSARSILSTFRRRDVMLPSITNAFVQFGVWALSFGFMPLLAHLMGASAVATSLLMTLNIAANMVANLFATFIAQKNSRRWLLPASFVAFAGGAILAALGTSIPFLFVATVIMGLANGLCFPILLGLSIERVDLSHRSTAMGIHQAVYAIGMFTGPWIGGVLSDAFGIKTMFAIIAAFCLIAPSLLIKLNSKVPAGG